MSDVETVVPEGYQKTKIGVLPNDWSVFGLDDVLTRVTRKNTTNNQNVLTISAQHGLINQEEFFNKKVASVDVSSYILLKKGEFAFNKSYSSGYPMGAIKRLHRYEQGVLSSLYIYFEVTKGDPVFYEHYFEYGGLNKEIYKIAQEGARNHGLLNISVVEFFRDLNIVFPPLPEQQRIATILNTWDEAITKQANLIALKEQRKRGLMQKLLTGEVRFPEFDGEWGKHKLHEIEKMGMISLSRGKVISKIDMKNNPGNYPVYSSSTKNNGLFGYYNEYMFDEELINWSVDGGGHFFYRPQHKFSITNVAGVLKVLSDKLSCQFLAYQLQLLHMSKRYDYSTKAHPSVIRYEYTIQIPPLSEQQKIAEVLSLADQEIEQLNKQLKALKEQKRGLMQKLLTGQVRVNVA